MHSPNSKATNSGGQSDVWWAVNVENLAWSSVDSKTCHLRPADEHLRPAGSSWSLLYLLLSYSVRAPRPAVISRRSQRAGEKAAYLTSPLGRLGQIDLHCRVLLGPLRADAFCAWRRTIPVLCARGVKEWGFPWRNRNDGSSRTHFTVVRRGWLRFVCESILSFRSIQGCSNSCYSHNIGCSFLQWI